MTTKQSVLDTLNTAPVYSLTIPSTKKKVKFRPFTVGEEQALLMVKESKDISMIIDNIKELIKKCTFDSVDPDELAYFDIEYFFLKLRAKSIGEEIELLLKCKTKECKGEIPYVYNIEEVKIPNIAKDANIVTLNESVTLTMRYPGFETLDALMHNPKDANIFKIVADLIEVITSGDNVYTASEFSDEERERFIKNMNSKTLKKIVTFIETSPKISYSVELSCPVCKETHTYTFEGIRNFFV